MCPHSHPAVALDVRTWAIHQFTPATQPSPPLCHPLRLASISLRLNAMHATMEASTHTHTCSACMPINWLQVEPCTARSGTARQGVRPNYTIICALGSVFWLCMHAPPC